MCRIKTLRVRYIALLRGRDGGKFGVNMPNESLREIPFVCTASSPGVPLC